MEVPAAKLHVILGVLAMKKDWKPLIETYVIKKTVGVQRTHFRMFKTAFTVLWKIPFYISSGAQYLSCQGPHQKMIMYSPPPTPSEAKIWVQSIRCEKQHYSKDFYANFHDFSKIAHLQKHVPRCELVNLLFFSRLTHKPTAIKRVLRAKRWRGRVPVVSGLIHSALTTHSVTLGFKNTLTLVFRFSRWKTADLQARSAAPSAAPRACRSAVFFLRNQRKKFANFRIYFHGTLKSLFLGEVPEMTHFQTRVRRPNYIIISKRLIEIYVYLCILRKLLVFRKQI